MQGNNFVLCVNYAKNSLSGFWCKIYFCKLFVSYARKNIYNFSKWQINFKEDKLLLGIQYLKLLMHFVNHTLFC